MGFKKSQIKKLYNAKYIYTIKKNGRKYKIYHGKFHDKDKMFALYKGEVLDSMSLQKEIKQIWVDDIGVKSKSNNAINVYYECGCFDVYEFVYPDNMDRTFHYKCRKCKNK